jgi:hypothetical protein
MNKFEIKRTGFGKLVLNNAATTINTGIFIPVGAIITGITWISPDAVTISATTLATGQWRCGTVALCATLNLSVIGAASIPTTTALTAGRLVSNNSLNNQINFICGSSVSTGVTGSYDVYVDYIYVNEHTV